MTIAHIAKVVDELEQNLLAISSLNDMCQGVMRDANGKVDWDPCIYLLNHLIEPAMYRIEEVRVQLGKLLDAESK